MGYEIEPVGCPAARPVTRLHLHRLASRFSPVARGTIRFFYKRKKKKKPGLLLQAKQRSLPPPKKEKTGGG
jgi:hypothetical protein